MKWPKWALKRLKQAIDASKKLSAIIVVIEDDTATLGLMRQFGIEYYGPVKGNISGKRILDKNRNKNIIKFYESIIDSINKFDSVQNIIIAGPGFYKNDFYDYIKDKHKDLASKSIIESTGTGGRVGIHEVLKKGTVEKLTVENIIMRSNSKSLDSIKKLNLYGFSVTDISALSKLPLLEIVSLSSNQIKDISVFKTLK